MGCWKLAYTPKFRGRHWHRPALQMEPRRPVRIWVRTISATRPSVNVQSVPRFLAASPHANAEYRNQITSSNNAPIALGDRSLAPGRLVALRALPAELGQRPCLVAGFDRVIRRGVAVSCTLCN